MNINYLLNPINNILNDTNILEIKSLISPACLHEELPITQKAYNNVIQNREIIKNILEKKDDRLLVIIGPCSIHDIKAAKEYAHFLKKLSDEVSDSLVIVMRTYFEKPRTKIGWKGLINDPDLNNSFNINKGLRLARQLLIEINELGLPTAIEFLDTISPQYLSDLISWGAIGARTTESQLHRELVSGLSMPIGFKNSTDGNITVAIDAMEASRHSHKFLGINFYGLSSIIKTKGNLHTHIILRGSNKSTNYNKEIIDETYHNMLDRNLIPNIIIDCSHGNSQKKFKNQLKVINYLINYIKNGYNFITGVMIESNIKEGNQKLDIKNLNNLEYGKSITDECINLEDTIIMLHLLANAVREKRVINYYFTNNSLQFKQENKEIEQIINI
jgi:3-deoxy-7-phosphoheptulonate synthase